MLSNSTLWKYSLALALILFIPLTMVGQKPFNLTEDTHQDDVFMTWNKNTPESEMKDDIKALADKGITIKYDDVKRNSKQEITEIKVSYSDRKGNKGNLEYHNENPIPVIQFYKQGEEIGFGSASQMNNGIAGNDFFNNLNGFANPQDIMKQFNFGNGMNDRNSQSFSFSFPDGATNGQSKSKIMIQKDGKKPLVIEDGKVTEGGEDYTPEEIEKIKSENRVEGFTNEGNSEKEFDFRSSEGLENFKKQMDEMKSEMKEINPGFDKGASKSELDDAKKELQKAKDEMIKAREELEKAKKEIQKSKPAIKTQKA
ncbi:hypothetical protein OX284_003370 [Flavobacterium sp. SUN046]|uniref:coiled-coil domain-containing protein n=1 Tax=Flavobacterium sp. SUN046 TaxID=3002440 RepID=UPI002DBDD2CD|nr:hypothetical protein [Flavobacterium sp. SUN046]MEC4048458.1 hypothetical protein [Flavobacterium sp. SUN046]